MNAQKWVLGNSQSAGPPVLPTRIHCDTHLKTHRHFNSHCCVGTNPHMHTKPHTFSQINTQSGISYTHIHMHSHTDKQLPRHTFSPSLPLSLSPSLPADLAPSRPVLHVSLSRRCRSSWGFPWILLGLDPGTRLPRPSSFPRVCSNSCPLSWWSHPTISFSVPLSPPAFSLSWHQGLF